VVTGGTDHDGAVSSLNPIDRVFGAIVPRAVDAIDMDEVLDQVDINHLISGVDLDAVLARLDMDALLERIDIQKIIDQVDIQKIIERVDIDGIIKRVDINGIIQQVDIDAVIGKVDMAAVVKRAGIDDIVSSASRGVIARMLDLVRRQLVGVDAVLISATNKVFRRPSEQASVASGTVTGRVAGGISRLVAFIADAFTISVTYGLMVGAVVYLVELLGGSNVKTTGHSLAWVLGYIGFGFFYYWIGLAITGRSIGKGLVGLRVVRKDGEPMSPGRAAVRTFVYPFSFILGLGLIPIVTGKNRRALHDWAGGDKVLYDWGDRPAELPAPLTAWVRRRTGEPLPGEPMAGEGDGDAVAV
jgi:uncharacterized RDD family membrane protein YckC